MKATIRNNFHDTERNVVLKDGKNEIRGRRLKEWKRALCCPDCTCSGPGGLRGNLYEPAIVSADGLDPVEWETAHDDRTGEEYLIVWAE